MPIPDLCVYLFFVLICVVGLEGFGLRCAHFSGASEALSLGVRAWVGGGGGGGGGLQPLLQALKTASTIVNTDAGSRGPSSIQLTLQSSEAPILLWSRRW